MSNHLDRINNINWFNLILSILGVIAAGMMFSLFIFSLLSDAFNSAVFCLIVMVAAIYLVNQLVSKTSGGSDQYLIDSK